MPNRFQATVALPVVMVIDDQTANVQVVGQLLTHADYDVVPVLDGREALALAERNPPDLVLLDMRMPGLDGFQVIAGLQALPQTRDVPVIFLTADHERDSLTRAFSAGAVDYVTKPFIAEELLARVRTHLDLKQARDRLARVADERQKIAEIVSHDLRNHFANILFSADMLRDPALNDDARQRLAQSIRTSADAGVLFLQAFLDQQQSLVHDAPPQPILARALLEECGRTAFVPVAKQRHAGLHRHRCGRRDTAVGGARRRAACAAESAVERAEIRAARQRRAPDGDAAGQVRAAHRARSRSRHFADGSRPPVPALRAFERAAHRRRIVDRPGTGLGQTARAHHGRRCLVRRPRRRRCQLHAGTAARMIDRTRSRTMAARDLVRRGFRL